jgi:hypothetical protein
MAGHTLAAIDLHAETCEAARLVAPDRTSCSLPPARANGGALLFPLFDPPL